MSLVGFAGEEGRAKIVYGTMAVDDHTDWFYVTLREGINVTTRSGTVPKRAHS